MELIKSILDALGSARISVALFLTALYAYSQQLTFTKEENWDAILQVLVVLTGLIVLNTIVGSIGKLIGPPIKEFFEWRKAWKRWEEVLPDLRKEELDVLHRLLYYGSTRNSFNKTTCYRLWRYGIVEVIGEGAQFGTSEGFAMFSMSTWAEKKLRRYFAKTKLLDLSKAPTESTSDLSQAKA